MMLKQSEWPGEYEFDRDLVDNLQLEYTYSGDSCGVRVSFRTTPKEYEVFLKMLSGEYKVIPKNG